MPVNNDGAGRRLGGRTSTTSIRLSVDGRPLTPPQDMSGVSIHNQQNERQNKTYAKNFQKEISADANLFLKSKAQKRRTISDEYDSKKVNKECAKIDAENGNADIASIKKLKVQNTELHRLESKALVQIEKNKEGLTNDNVVTTTPWERFGKTEAEFDAESVKKFIKEDKAHHKRMNEVETNNSEIKVLTKKLEKVSNEAQIQDINNKIKSLTDKNNVICELDSVSRENFILKRKMDGPSEIHGKLAGGLGQVTTVGFANVKVSRNDFIRGYREYNPKLSTEIVTTVDKVMHSEKLYRFTSYNTFANNFLESRVTSIQTNAKNSVISIFGKNYDFSGFNIRKDEKHFGQFNVKAIKSKLKNSEEFKSLSKTQQKELLKIFKNANKQIKREHKVFNLKHFIPKTTSGILHASGNVTNFVIGIVNGRHLNNFMNDFKGGFKKGLTIIGKKFIEKTHLEGLKNKVVGTVKGFVYNTKIAKVLRNVRTSIRKARGSIRSAFGKTSVGKFIKSQFRLDRTVFGKVNSFLGKTLPNAIRKTGYSLGKLVGKGMAKIKEFLKWLFLGNVPGRIVTAIILVICITFTALAFNPPEILDGGPTFNPSNPSSLFLSTFSEVQMGRNITVDNNDIQVKTDNGNSEREYDLSDVEVARIDEEENKDGETSSITTKSICDNTSGNEENTGALSIYCRYRVQIPIKYPIAILMGGAYINQDIYADKETTSQAGDLIPGIDLDGYNNLFDMCFYEYMKGNETNNGETVDIKDIKNSEDYDKLSENAKKCSFINPYTIYNANRYMLDYMNYKTQYLYVKFEDEYHKAVNVNTAMPEAPDGYGDLQLTSLTLNGSDISSEIGNFSNKTDQYTYCVYAGKATAKYSAKKYTCSSPNNDAGCHIESGNGGYQYDENGIPICSSTENCSAKLIGEASDVTDKIGDTKNIDIYNCKSFTDWAWVDDSDVGPDGYEKFDTFSLADGYAADLNRGDQTTADEDIPENRIWIGAPIDKENSSDSITDIGWKRDFDNLIKYTIKDGLEGFNDVNTYKTEVEKFGGQNSKFSLWYKASDGVDDYYMEQYDGGTLNATNGNVGPLTVLKKNNGWLEITYPTEDNPVLYRGKYYWVIKAPEKAYEELMTKYRPDLFNDIASTNMNSVNSVKKYESKSNSEALSWIKNILKTLTKRSIGEQKDENDCVFYYTHEACWDYASAKGKEDYEGNDIISEDFGYQIKVNSDADGNYPLQTITVDIPALHASWSPYFSKALNGKEIEQKLYDANLTNNQILAEYINDFKVVENYVSSIYTDDVFEEIDGNAVAMSEENIKDLHAGRKALNDAVDTDGFVFPWKNPEVIQRVTTTYRDPTRPKHEAVDIAHLESATMVASISGTVRDASHDYAGYKMFIDGTINGVSVTVLYEHMNHLDVHSGDVVLAGQVIGTAGYSQCLYAPEGWSKNGLASSRFCPHQPGQILVNTGSHSHFAIYFNGVSDNPIPYLINSLKQLSEETGVNYDNQIKILSSGLGAGSENASSIKYTSNAVAELSAAETVLVDTEDPAAMKICSENNGSWIKDSESDNEEIKQLIKDANNSAFGFMDYEDYIKKVRGDIASKGYTGVCSCSDASKCKENGFDMGTSDGLYVKNPDEE